MLWPLPHFWPPFQTCFLSVPSWAIYSTSSGHSSFVYKIQRITPISKGDNVCQSSAGIVGGTRQTERTLKMETIMKSELLQPHSSAFIQN